jgi:hypothetical protein
MTANNKKYLWNKTATLLPLADPETETTKTGRTVVVELMAGRAKAPSPDISPAAESLRLVQAFLRITDPAKRADLIMKAEEYVQGTR